MRFGGPWIWRENHDGPCALGAKRAFSYWALYAYVSARHDRRLRVYCGCWVRGDDTVRSHFVPALWRAAASSWALPPQRYQGIPRLAEHPVRARNKVGRDMEAHVLFWQDGVLRLWLGCIELLRVNTPWLNFSQKLYGGSTWPRLHANYRKLSIESLSPKRRNRDNFTPPREHC